MTETCERQSFPGVYPLIFQCTDTKVSNTSQCIAGIAIYFQFCVFVTVVCRGKRLFMGVVLNLIGRLTLNRCVSDKVYYRMTTVLYCVA